MQTSRRKYVNVMLRSVLVGFVGGLSFILLSYFLYVFNFLEISPESYIVKIWATSSWTNSWLGIIATMSLGSVLSIIAALVYFVLFKKIMSVWMGIVYGIILWLMIGYLFSLVFVHIPAPHTLSSDTVVSSLCLFILYGTFVGYSISFDYYQTVYYSSES